MAPWISIYLLLSKYYILSSLHILKLWALILNQMWKILSTLYVKIWLESKIAVSNKAKPNRKNEKQTKK